MNFRNLFRVKDNLLRSWIDNVLKEQRAKIDALLVCDKACVMLRQKS